MEKEIVDGYRVASELFRGGKLNEALGLCMALLKKYSTNTALLNLAGSILYKKDLFEEAEFLLSAAHELEPASEEIALNLVRVLMRTERVEQAASVLEMSLALKPESERMLSMLGEIYYFNKRPDLAVLAFERIRKQGNATGDILFRLACSYQENGKAEAALDTYRQLLELDPAHADGCVNFAQLYKSVGDYDAAMALFEQAAALVPDDSTYASKALFCLNYGFVDGETCLEKSVQWAERFGDPVPPDKTPRLVKSDSGRVRLGFLSADFTSHPVGRLFLPVLKMLDRGRFDIHCFSNVQIADDMTRQFREAASRYHDISAMNDDAASERIRKMGIDVLVDLSGHSNFNRLGVLARKPAPVQIMWLGYFNTTGMRAVDYVLADPVNVPAGNERFYREEVLRLPDSFFPYAVHEGVEFPVTEPSDTVTFGCFNDSGKINDTVLAAWAAILNNVPGSRLLLKSKLYADMWVRERLLERMDRQSLPSERVVFLPPSGFDEYLQEYAKVDICLDPFPYSGGATTADALFTGTPVLTCPFQNFGSRLSASLLTACGMERLICDGVDEYVAKGVELGTNGPALAQVTDELRSRFRSSPLCDVEKFTRDLEKILLGAADVGVEPDGHPEE